MPNNIPLGWVNRYGDKVNPHACFVGIDICKDAYLNRGLGTEALQLWVNRIFSTSDVHKIGLETWSFNPRMIRVAEKAGFVREGRQREIRQWQGEWLGLVQFGIVREEWQKKRGVEGDSVIPTIVERQFLVEYHEEVGYSSKVWVSCGTVPETGHAPGMGAADFHCTT